MEKNVGELDAFLRITGGLAMLGMGIMHSSKMLTILGSMKVAEGITRFCPLLYLLKMDSLELKLKPREKHEEEIEIPVTD